MRLEFLVPGSPIGKPRPRVTGRGAYMPTAYRDYQRTVRDAALVAFAELVERGGNAWAHGAEMRVWLDFALPDRRRRDLDNLAGGVLDALTKIVWGDDAQVVYLRAAKTVCRAAPGVRVAIEDGSSC